MKTESGAKVKATKTGIYKKWKERSHKKVSLRGTDHDGRSEDNANVSGTNSEINALLRFFIFNFLIFIIRLLILLILLLLFYSNLCIAYHNFVGSSPDLCFRFYILLF